MLAFPVHNPQTNIHSSSSNPDRRPLRYAATILTDIEREMIKREKMIWDKGIVTRDIVEPITGNRKGLK